MEKVNSISQDDFEQQVIAHSGKVLVDFYAPWCGPCKMIAPIVEKIANDHSDIKVVKVDSDQATDLMTKYGIRGIPTLLLIENGELIDRKVGAASLSQVKAFIERQ
ncbi:thioredoxin [Thalassotalea ganghwensis]